jgi:hypothetical protein
VFIFRLMTVTAEPLYIAGEGAKLWQKRYHIVSPQSELRHTFISHL